MKILNIVLKVVLCLILITPILGALGVFPPPTADLYNTPQGFAFINMLFATKYILYTEALVFLAAILLIVSNRIALAALLILPITVNIISFHAFLDGGLLNSGAVLAWILLMLNAYFLWQNRAKYQTLLEKSVKI
jgi:hypothetical protein